jgi:hypothetical protein
MPMATTCQTMRTATMSKDLAEAIYRAAIRQLRHDVGKL